MSAFGTSDAFKAALREAREEVGKRKDSKPFGIGADLRHLASVNPAHSRQHARAEAMRARMHARDVEDILIGAGDLEAAAAAALAGEALTAVIAATHEGESEVFACRR